MRVVTLRDAELSEHCRRLEALAAAFGPDLIVGVASGGVHVASRMFEGVAHTQIAARRPSTSGKQRAGAAMRLVRRMPLWVRDALRLAEALMLRATRGGKKPAAHIDGEARHMVEGARRVLVVDDAVDSGRTLQAVLALIASLPGERATASAAITVTTKHPAVRPDFHIYDNQTLLRFPWSMDMTPKENSPR